MRKALFLFMVFGLVGLMCGSTSGQDAEVKKNVTKLKETGNCQKCNLYFANLKDADLNKANLTGADLTKANLTGADLSKANLSQADLTFAKLTGANLSQADLTEADLKGANMKNIRNLDSAIKCKTIMPWGEDNSGCK